MSHVDDDDPSGVKRTAVISSEEARLVAAAKAGDQRAFAELVEATQADVYTLAYRIVGNVDDARDVAQEAYLRAFMSLKLFRGDAQFSTWMYSITANCAALLLRQQSRTRCDRLSDDDNILDERSESDPEGMSEAALLRDRVSEALADLPPTLRAVVVLRDVYELSHDAIAAELGISESASKVRLHRARRMLRDKLFPDMPTHKAKFRSPDPEAARSAAIAITEMRGSGLAWREIGERLHLSADTARKRVAAAQRLLGELGDDPNKQRTTEG